MTYEESLSRHERCILDLDKAAIQHEKEIKDLRENLLVLERLMMEVWKAIEKLIQTVQEI
jgi:hypothetical protein